MTSSLTDRIYGESASVALKAPCVAVALTPVPLAGLGAVSGGYSPQPNDRVLVMGQTDPTANGIYNASNGTWTRSGDFDGAYDAVQGTLIAVISPVSGGSIFYQLTTFNPIIGTTPLTFSSFINPTSITYDLTQAEFLAGCVLVVKSARPGNIVRYGASTTNADNSISIQAAINQALQVGGAPVRIPCGVWNYATGLLVTGPIEVVGDDMYTAILRKTANVVGMTVADVGSSFGQATLQGFSLLSAGGDSSNGLTINTIGRVRLRQIIVGAVGSGHGGHGLELLQSTVGRYDDISSVANGGDGVRLTGLTGVQANANTFTNIDSRGNTGWGFNVVNGRTNFGIGIVLQSNQAGGIQLDTVFGNHFQVYAESNAGPAISFTANCVAPNFGGNVVDAIFSSAAPVFNGLSAQVNLLIRNQAGASYQTNYSQLIADVLTFSNNRIDGVTPVGVMNVSHTVDNQYDFIAGSGGDAVVNWGNTAGVINHTSTGYVAGAKGVYPNGFAAGAKPGLFSGAGTPAGAFAAPVGSLYLRSDGGASTTLYVKESGGAGTGGWVAK